MQKAKNGDMVKVHFTGRLEDGTPFASTAGEEPLELVVGDGKLIGCFEESIVGMTEGEQKTVHIHPEEAMGEWRPELVAHVPRHIVPEQEEDLKAGSRISFKNETGTDVNATVTELSDQHVTLDANHTLAGKALTFDIERVELG